MKNVKLYSASILYTLAAALAAITKGEIALIVECFVILILAFAVYMLYQRNKRIKEAKEEKEEQELAKAEAELAAQKAEEEKEPEPEPEPVHELHIEEMPHTEGDVAPIFGEMNVEKSNVEEGLPVEEALEVADADVPFDREPIPEGEVLIEPEPEPEAVAEPEPIAEPEPEAVVEPEPEAETIPESVEDFKAD